MIATAGGTSVTADKLDGVDSAVVGTVQTHAGMRIEPRESEGTETIYDTTGSIRLQRLFRGLRTGRGRGPLHAASVVQ